MHASFEQSNTKFCWRCCLQVLQALQQLPEMTFERTVNMLHSPVGTYQETGLISTVVDASSGKWHMIKAIKDAGHSFPNRGLITRQEPRR